MTDQHQTDFVKTVLIEIRKNRLSANARTITWLALGVSFATINILSTSSIKTNIPSGEPYVALIRISGTIDGNEPSSLRYLENSLYSAFHDENAKGVLLAINSPGGTPVQSSALYQYINFLKKSTGKHVVALGEDMLTSGAYMVAVAADKIIVNPSTLTGSIGVYQQSFGLTGLIKTAGIEPRTLYAGEHKRRLDPFLETTTDDITKTQSVLNEIHEQFIALVREGRGDRLKGEPNELFSGDYWTGEKAVNLGLVDTIGTYHYTLQNEFGVNHAMDYTPSKTWGDSFIDIFSMISATTYNKLTAQTLLPKI